VTYFITYVPTGPAYPCHAEQRTEWITPSGMTTEQATTAFQQQFPTALIVSCTPKP
jgi:hypothetical protein